MLDARAVAAHAPELPAVAAAFEAHGFDAAGVLALLGAPAFSDVPRTLRARRGRSFSFTPAGALVSLFVRGDLVPRAEVAALLGDALPLLETVGVVETRKDAARATCVLLPVRCGDAAVWIAHDRHDAAGEVWAVMPPDRSSEFLARAAAPAAGRRWLDVGCGSGVIALLAARRGASRVVAADVNPSAPAFVALGAALSGLAVETCVSDLFAAVPAGRWDVITFNAPWLYHRARARWQGSPEGPRLLTRFLAELDARLDERPGAEALVHAQLPDEPALLPERLVGLDCARWRTLSLRHVNLGVVLPGLLWVARPGAAGAWAAERRAQSADDLAAGFVERGELEELVGKIESSG